jgi:hypothetical protein
MAKMGRPSKGERKKVTVPLDAEIYQELKAHCAGAPDRDMGETVAKAFVDWWEKQTEARKLAREFIEKSKERAA